MRKPPKPTKEAKAFVITGGRARRKDSDPTPEQIEQGRKRRAVEDAIELKKLKQGTGDVWDM